MSAERVDVVRRQETRDTTADLHARDVGDEHEPVGAVARKVGEEGVELVVAALDESDERVIEEAADLVYHLYVLLAARGLDVAQVEDELRVRAKLQDVK